MISDIQLKKTQSVEIAVLEHCPISRLTLRRRFYTPSLVDYGPVLKLTLTQT